MKIRWRNGREKSHPLKGVGAELQEVWGQEDLKTISWPLVIRAGIIK